MKPIEEHKINMIEDYIYESLVALNALKKANKDNSIEDIRKQSKKLWFKTASLSSMADELYTEDVWILCAANGISVANWHSKID